MDIRGNVVLSTQSSPKPDRSGHFTGTVSKSGILRLDHTTLPEFWMEVNLSAVLGESLAPRPLPYDPRYSYIRGRAVLTATPATGRGFFIGHVMGDHSNYLLRIDHTTMPEFWIEVDLYPLKPSATYVWSS